MNLISKFNYKMPGKEPLNGSDADVEIEPIEVSSDPSNDPSNDAGDSSGQSESESESVSESKSDSSGLSGTESETSESSLDRRLQLLEHEVYLLRHRDEIFHGMNPLSRCNLKRENRVLKEQNLLLAAELRNHRIGSWLLILSFLLMLCVRWLTWNHPLMREHTIIQLY
jgi:hypothetical protein